MIGTVLGRYRIVDKIGAGGMGVVYRAHDQRLDRDVALKVLPEGSLFDADALRQFRKEALTLSRLNHPNIATVHDFDTQNGVTFLVMELILGETLAQRLAQTALAEQDVARLGGQICRALEEAHDVGIVHCDLKPSNVMVTPKGQVKVLDFGLARLLRPMNENTVSDSYTDTEALAGTVPYMAPEQLLGEKVDRRTDLYSLGVVLYEMCTGRRPFDEKTMPRLTEAILHEAPRVPSATNSRISPAFDSVVLKAIEKGREHRYQSARELCIDLERLASPGSPRTLARPRRRRLQSRVLAGLLAAAALAGLVAWRLWGSSGSVPRRIDSVVVLPLLNATDNPEADYLGEGISESVINSLSQLHGLRVVARSTALAYAHAHKGEALDPRRVGEELGGRAVVMGKVTQRGGASIIQADLVDAADGAQLWGARYDPAPADILDVSQDMVRRISENLHFQLTAEETSKITQRPTANDQAYRYYLKGRYYSSQWSFEGFKKAIQNLNQAIDIDPTYALAYAGLAACYYDASGPYLPPDEAMPTAEAAAHHALELDPNLAEALTVLAQIKGYYNWEWAEAEGDYQKALASNPGYAPAHQWYGCFLATQGRLKEATAQVAQARVLDPLTPFVSTSVGWLEYLARRYDRSVQESQKVLQVHPDFHVAHYNLGLAYEQQHLYAQAIAEFEEARRLDPENPFPLGLLGHVYGVSGAYDKARGVLDRLEQMTKSGRVDPFYFAITYIGLGDKDMAFTWLEKAADFHSEEILLLKVDPRFDDLRSDPRFTELARRLKLVG